METKCTYSIGEVGFNPGIQNSDDKTWQENSIKLALGKTVVKFMGLKLPRGSMQASVRSFGPLDSSSRKSANLPQFHS